MFDPPKMRRFKTIGNPTAIRYNPNGWDTLGEHRMSAKNISRASLRRGSKPPGDRPSVHVRVEPAVYQKLVAAAETNRMSVSAVAERQLEKSLEAVWEDASVTYEGAHALDQPMSAAFEAGLRFGNPEQPIAELLRDGAAFDRGIIRVVGALLDAHPEPRWGDILHLMTSIHGLLGELWKAARKPDFEQGRPLPKLETLDEMALRDEREHAARKSPADKDPSQ
jgi:hypothetical protein